VAASPKLSNRSLAPLCAICDAEVCAKCGWTVVDLASACLDGGARFLQIRSKRESSLWLFDVTMAVVRRAEGTGALVVVNDRADIARAAGAGGVHVGQDDLEPDAVRAIVGEGVVVGLSTHTDAQLDEALKAPVDYVAIGPVFTTSTKVTGHDAVGLDRVRRAARKAGERDTPLVAIGGVTLERAAEVLAAGAQSVAVISDLLATGDPAARVREYLKRLDQQV
jgi:thiamine-phosphate pyrophosphorylase